MQNQILEINFDTNLTGKVASSNFLVLVCDATYGALTITLPDSNSIRNVAIVSTKKDSSENSITFVCKLKDQRINSSTSAKLLYQNDSMMLFPYKDGYVIGSINQTI